MHGYGNKIKGRDEAMSAEQGNDRELMSCPQCGAKLEMYYSLPEGKELSGADNEISITIRGQEQVAIVMKALHAAGFVHAQGAPAAEAQPANVAERVQKLRDGGWMVAVHNDYRQDGKLRTFWLFVRDGRAVKGEGDTDAEALEAVLDILVAEGKPMSVERIRTAYQEVLDSYKSDGTGRPPTFGRASIQKAWDKLNSALVQEGEGEKSSV